MSNALKKYQRTTTGETTIFKVTSVNITLEQYEFLKSRGLSVSLIVRDRIRELMAEETNPKIPNDEDNKS